MALIPPSRISVKKFIEHDDMQAEVNDLGILKEGNVEMNDSDRTLYTYKEKGGNKYLVKIGNHMIINDIEKCDLLQNEHLMYSHLSNKLGADYNKYFPRILDGGIMNRGDTQNEFYFIIMEFIEGESLFDYISTKTPSEDDHLVILLNLTKALEAMYSTGVVHGDLSAENIMIQENLNVKIIDLEKGSTSKKLSVNTIGNTHISRNSNKTNIIKLEKKPNGLGYLFIAIHLLSLVPSDKTLILSIMRKVLECEDKCKNVYTECIKVIQDFNSSGGANEPRERSYAGSPVSDPMTNTRRRKLRKRKTRKL